MANEMKANEMKANEMKANEMKAIDIVFVNKAIRNMSENLVKLSEFDIQCGSGCHKDSTLVNSYVFNSPHQHRIMLTCDKCRETWKTLFKESQVIQHNCLFCGIDPVDCDKKWFYNEQESTSICNDCFTTDLTDKFIAFGDISNYYVLYHDHIQLLNLEPLTELNIPLDKITPDRVSMWFSHIPNITGMDNSIQRIATWLPFTDLVNTQLKQPKPNIMVDSPEEASDPIVDKKIMLINCNGGQVAEAIVSNDGVVVRIVNNSIQEYEETSITSMFNGMSEDCTIC